MKTAVQELIEEHKRAELLRSHGLEPRNRVLLDGPPGNGKTSLAEAIATETMLPFYVVRYEGSSPASSVRRPRGWIMCSSRSHPALCVVLR